MQGGTRAGLWFVAGVCALSAGGDARGLIVVNEMERPGDGYVGRWAGSSAVAIGEHWILTAAHVGGSVGNDFRMQRESFTAEAMIRHHSADLMLVRVREALPGWHEVTGDVSRHDRVVLAGVGHTVGDAIGKKAFAWSDDLRAAWGENTIHSVQGDLLAMRFYTKGKKALPHEAAFAYRDSGGGVFVQGADGSLSLAGIAISSSMFGWTQHGATSHALSLASFMDWIDEATRGEVGTALGRGYPPTGFAIPSPGGAALFGVFGLMAAQRSRG